MSNGYSPDGGRYLEHAFDVLSDALAGVRQVAFVPYALRDWDGHSTAVADALAPLGVKVVATHECPSPTSLLESAEAVFVGGGNAFRLLAAMYAIGALDAITKRVAEGMPYIGTSAGTNVACPTIRTTNDMPIAEPPSLAALHLIPFQVNPHYPAREVLDGHLGETRDRRLGQFLEDNDVPVLALHEGAWLDVNETSMTVDGARGARVFQRFATPVDIRPGTDVSHLLTAVGHFDNPIS